MSTIQARYEGGVLIPDEPLDLSPGERVSLEVRAPEDAESGNSRAAATRGVETPARQDKSRDPSNEEVHRQLSQLAHVLPDDIDLPTDLAAQHDHYLYGTPKRANP